MWSSQVVGWRWGKGRRVVDRGGGPRGGTSVDGAAGDEAGSSGNGLLVVGMRGARCVS